MLCLYYQSGFSVEWFLSLKWPKKMMRCVRGLLFNKKKRLKTRVINSDVLLLMTLVFDDEGTTQPSQPVYVLVRWTKAHDGPCLPTSFMRRERKFRLWNAAGKELLDFKFPQECCTFFEEPFYFFMFFTKNESASFFTSETLPSPTSHRLTGVSCIYLDYYLGAWLRGQLSNLYMRLLPERYTCNDL